MEEEDELIPPPDIRGFLDLTNRAWVNLDPELWTLSRSIIVLDISYNRLHTLPGEIGCLQLLRELRAAFNMITFVAPEIGKLKRLKKLTLNGNRLTHLPNEVGRLEMLEELILSENALEELPHSISTMSMLRILKLQNNNLREIPFTLVDVVTLEELDISGNTSLTMVPKQWQGDTESILFVCKIHRDYHWQMSEVSSANSDLIKHSQYLEQDQLLMKDQIAKYKNDIDTLKKLVKKSALRKFEQNARIASELDEGVVAPKKSKCTIM